MALSLAYVVPDMTLLYNNIKRILIVAHYLFKMSEKRSIIVLFHIPIASFFSQKIP